MTAKPTRSMLVSPPPAPCVPSALVSPSSSDEEHPATARSDAATRTAAMRDDVRVSGPRGVDFIGELPGRRRGSAYSELPDQNARHISPPPLPRVHPRPPCDLLFTPP